MATGDPNLVSILYPNRGWADRLVLASLPTRTATATFRGDSVEALRMLTERGRIINNEAPSKVQVVLDTRTFAGKRAFDEAQPMLVTAALAAGDGSTIELVAVAKRSLIDRGGLAANLDAVVHVLEAGVSERSDLAPVNELQRHPATADEIASAGRGDRGVALRIASILYVLLGVSLWIFAPAVTNGWVAAGMFTLLGLFAFVAFAIGWTSRTRSRPDALE